MQNLSFEEAKKVTGGGISGWAVIGIGALVVFISGIIDGFTRPLACNK